MAHIGRNDPCPCKSGKKYKACCLGKENNLSHAERMQKYSTVYNDLAWTKMRTAEGEIDRILEMYINKELEDTIHEDAWDDFVGDDTSSKDAKAYEYFFKSWMYHSWTLGSEFSLDEEETTIAKMCLEEHPEFFTSYQKKLLEAINKAYFSFFIVQNTIPGQRLFLKDIMLQTEIELKEATSSKTLTKGDIILCRPVTFEGQSLAISMAPCVIPNRFFTVIVGLRDWIFETEEISAFTPEDFHLYDQDIRELYFKILEEASQPMQFSNTDQEPIILHELFYDLKCTPLEAFEALSSLCPKERALPWTSRTLDSQGNFEEICISWTRINDPNDPQDNISLGCFTISPTELKVFINSHERATRAKKEVEHRLGDKVFLKNQKITPMTSSEQLQDLEEKSIPNNTLLNYPPEMLEALKAHVAKIWIKWLDTDIPALGNITPRQAVKSKSGQEKLDALFLDFEKTNEQITDPDEEYQRIDIDFLKKELGLPF